MARVHMIMSMVIGSCQKSLLPRGPGHRSQWHQPMRAQHWPGVTNHSPGCHHNQSYAPRGQTSQLLITITTQIFVSSCRSLHKLITRAPVPSSSWSRLYSDSGNFVPARSERDVIKLCRCPYNMSNIELRPHTDTFDPFATYLEAPRCKRELFRIVRMKPDLEWMDSEILHWTALIYRSHFHAIAAIPSFSGEGSHIQFKLSSGWRRKSHTWLLLVPGAILFFSKVWWPFPAEFCLRPEAIFWRQFAHVPYFFQIYETHQRFSSKYMTLYSQDLNSNSSMTFLSSWSSGLRLCSNIVPTEIFNRHEGTHLRRSI